MELMKRLWKEEEGQGMVEYALIIGVLALVIVAVGPKILAIITDLFDKVKIDSIKLEETK